MAKSVYNVVDNTLGACGQALDWLDSLNGHGVDPNDAWNACPRGEWLVWCIDSVLSAAKAPADDQLRRDTFRAAVGEAKRMRSFIIDDMVARELWDEFLFAFNNYAEVGVTPGEWVVDSLLNRADEMKGVATAAGHTHLRQLWQRLEYLIAYVQAPAGYSLWAFFEQIVSDIIVRARVNRDRGERDELRALLRAQQARRVRTYFPTPPAALLSLLAD
jgi:hypothetical protein